jgi:DNA-binding CsgD family transcriptional regulator
MEGCLKSRECVDDSFVMLDGCRIGLADLGGKPPAGPRSAIADELSGTQSPAQRRLLIRTMLGAIGFDWLCYWRLTRVGDAITRVVYVCEYAAPGWPDRYVEQRYIEIDPRIAFACRHEWPLIWDLPSLAQDASTTVEPRLRGMLDDAHAAGLRSGITFGLVSPRSPHQSVVSFSCANLSKHWIGDRIVGQAYALGLALHEYLLDHATPLDALADTPSAKPISPVQRRILSALTQGMSDKQIADQLQMSTHNVDYHLRLLKKRYGALNRVHLAYLAGQRDAK